MAGIDVAADVSNASFEISSTTSDLFVELISPSDGAELKAGTTYTITWDSNGISAVDIYFDSDEITENLIAENVPASNGYFEWEIPESFISNECYLWIGDNMEQAEDYNAEPFKIVGSSQEPYIEILAPDGSEQWKVGTVQKIVWESELVSSFIISYSVDGGENWALIESNYTPSAVTAVANQYQYSWTIPNTVSSNCLVGMLDAQDTDVGDISDNAFQIIPAEQEVELLFEYYTYGEISLSSPAIAPDGTIYIGSADTYLHAINPDGSYKWYFETGEQIWSSPAIGEDGVIYFGSYDYYFYAIYPTGKKKWSLQTDGSIISSPAIGSDGTIYFGTFNGTLYAVTPDKTVRWTKALGTEIIKLPDNRK